MVNFKFSAYEKPLFILYYPIETICIPFVGSRCSFTIQLSGKTSPLRAARTPPGCGPPPPPAPEAASLAKCINFPVDYNTGVPRIEIPLFEMKGCESSLLLVISYHAGGFKAKEESAYTGLGWSLSSDFQIVREIRGHDDFRQLSGYSD